MPGIPQRSQIDSRSPRVSPFNYQAVGHSVFAVGRFLSAIAGLFVKPRHILLGLYVGCVVSSALAMNLTGDAGVAVEILILLFEVCPAAADDDTDLRC